jgi:hypothetical protein
MDRTLFKNIIAALLVTAVFSSCKKESPDCCTIPTGAARKIYIVCEGSLGNGNAALSAYEPDSNRAYEDVFKAKNGQTLGDVFQSMEKTGPAYALCINNSDKVLMVSADDLTLLHTVSVQKPRYFLPLSETKAFVTSIFSNKMYALDLTDRTTQAITLPYQNTEGIIALDNTHTLVATWDTASNKLYSIDNNTNQVTDSITIAGRAPQSMLYDKEGKLWVLSGNVPKGKNAALTRIDPATKQVLASYQFAANADAIKPAFNKAKDSLYFIEVDYNGGTQHNGIYRMGIHDASLPAQAFIPAQQYQYFWALGIDPKTGLIYVGDPKGFTQKGTVYIYRADGTLTGQFSTGVGPGHFYFTD